VSAENVDFVRAAFASWIGGRIDEFRALLDEDLAWDITEHPLPDFPNTGTGREAFLRNLGEYARGWVDYRAELAEAVDAGDDVIAVVHEWARMRDTGVDIDRDLVIVWTVADRRLTRFRVYRTREDALAALASAAS
jgi:ketosteroid isomerase-like protein